MAMALVTMPTKMTMEMASRMLKMHFHWIVVRVLTLTPMVLATTLTQMMMVMA